MGTFFSSPKEGEVKIGAYLVSLTSDIGNGSFGMVCKARYISQKEDVAVKKIPFTFEGEVNQEIKEMASAEAEIMMKIRHPNIVSLLDVHLQFGSAWLFMEFCDKGDLKKYLSNNDQMSLCRKFTLIQQITSAVSHLHSQYPPIVHRDIKPGNVLMKRCSGEEVAKLTDFGFARIYDLNLSQSGSTIFQHLHSLKGTPSYMAPEFYFEEETGLRYTSSVDIFSLGLVHAVILEYGPHNRDTHPISVEMRKQNKVVNFGYEMSECHRRSEVLPHIVEVMPDDDQNVQTLKKLILQMTQFRDKDRIHIRAVEHQLQEIQDKQKCMQSSLLDLASRRLSLKQIVTLSASPFSLRRIGDELLSCQDDGISVYSSDLKLLRSLRLPQFTYIWSVAALASGGVVTAGASGLHTMTQSGGDVTKQVDGFYMDMVVHNNQCYACGAPSPVIEVYDCEHWRLVTSIPLPGCCSDCLTHTLSVTDHHITVCCWVKNKISILSTSGELLSRHGPEIAIRAAQRESEAAATTRSRLGYPYLCEEDSAGALLLTDWASDCLLVCGAAGEWRQVTTDGEMDRPVGAVWWNQRLYVSTYGDRSLIMYS